MKHSISLLVLFFSLALGGFAQSSLKGLGVLTIKKTAVKPAQKAAVKPAAKPTAKTAGKSSGRTVVRQTALKSYTSDTVYCTQTKKQHGWFAPMDTIDASIALHRNRTYRFTQKNSAGHWEKLECVNAYGRYTPSGFAPYILKNGGDDRNAKQEWKDKAGTACVHEFVSDPTGREIVQEIAYDDQHHVVFTYSRVPAGRNQYLGSYRDHNGLPVEMLNDDEATYGTLIRITEDRWGNDSVLQFVDAAGKVKLNADSAAMEVRVCDRYGHLLKQQSLDADGRLMIDRAGNCGVEYVWKNHQIVAATYMDDSWRPVRMQAKSSGTERNTMRIHYEYDGYFRDTNEYFTDADDVPDANEWGTHSVKSYYDDKGNCVGYKGFDLKGALSPIFESLVADIETKYDSCGREIFARFLDCHGRPCSVDGYLSKRKTDYDSEGRAICREEYTAASGEEKLSNKVVTAKDHVYTLFNDGTSRVDSLDSKGRTTFVGFYDNQGELYECEGRAYEVHTYTDRGRTTLHREIDYDAHGRRVDVANYEICETVILADSVNLILKKYYYAADGTLKVVFQHRMNDDFSEILGQDDINAFGTVTRSGGANDVRYFKGNVMYTPNDKITSIYGRDEFDRPDYIVADGGLYYYQKNFPNNTIKYYDTDNNEIDDTEALKDSLTKVMTIEVTDSAAYRRGLRDNDVILLYGNYAADLYTGVTDLAFRQKWTLRSVIDARKSKRMVVFRITDAAKGKYGLYEIDGLVGTPSELGFIPHMRYLTARQRQRINLAVCEEELQTSPLLTRNDLCCTDSAERKHYVMMALPQTFRSYRDKTYTREVKDGAVLLSSCVKARNLSWTYRDNDDCSSLEEMLSSRKDGALTYPRHDFYFTTDANRIVHISTEERGVWTNWFDALISDADYRELVRLHRAAADSVDRIFKTDGPSLKAKDFYGNWVCRMNGDDPYSPVAHYTFCKDNTFRAVLCNYGRIRYNEGTAVFRSEQRVTGTWSVGEDWLFTESYEADSLRLSCVDIDVADEAFKRRCVAFLNKPCREHPEAMLGGMEFDGDFSDNLCQVTAPSKDSFSAWYDNLEWKPLGFIRTKEPVVFSEQAEEEEVAEDVVPLSEDLSSDSRYLGEWTGDVSGAEGSQVTLAFFRNSKAEIRMNLPLAISDSVTLVFTIVQAGNWSAGGEDLTFKFDDSSPQLQAVVYQNGNAIDISGAEEAVISQMKAQLGLQLVSLFGGELSMEPEDDDTLVTSSGQKLVRRAAGEAGE